MLLAGAVSKVTFIRHRQEKGTRRERLPTVISRPVMIRKGPSASAIFSRASAGVPRPPSTARALLRFVRKYADISCDPRRGRWFRTAERRSFLGRLLRVDRAYRRKSSLLSSFL